MDALRSMDVSIRWEKTTVRCYLRVVVQRTPHAYQTSGPGIQTHCGYEKQMKGETPLSLGKGPTDTVWNTNGRSAE